MATCDSLRRGTLNLDLGVFFVPCFIVLLLTSMRTKVLFILSVNNLRKTPPYFLVGKQRFFQRVNT